MSIAELFIIATNWKQPKFPVKEKSRTITNYLQLFKMTNLWTIVMPGSVCIKEH